MNANTINSFEIVNTRSGHTLGIYSGESGDDAIEACLRDAGHDGSIDPALRALPVQCTEYYVYTSNHNWRREVSGPYSTEHDALGAAAELAAKLHQLAADAGVKINENDARTSVRVQCQTYLGDGEFDAETVASWCDGERYV